MPNYQHYPTAKEVPNRKQRKHMRGIIFWENQILMNEIRRQRRAAKKAAEALKDK